MTPRDLDVATVLERLALMRELLSALDAMTPVTEEVLSGDIVKRLAVERALCQLVDTATDINQHLAAVSGENVITEYRDSFDAAERIGLIDHNLAKQLKPSVGLRNVLIHEYIDVKLSIVAMSVSLAREFYGQYIKSVAKYIAVPRTASP